MAKYCQNIAWPCHNLAVMRATYESDCDRCAQPMDFCLACSMLLTDQWLECPSARCESTGVPLRFTGMKEIDTDAQDRN